MEHDSEDLLWWNRECKRGRLLFSGCGSLCLRLEQCLRCFSNSVARRLSGATIWWHARRLFDALWILHNFMATRKNLFASYPGYHSLQWRAICMRRRQWSLEEWNIQGEARRLSEGCPTNDRCHRCLLANDNRLVICHSCHILELQQRRERPRC